MQHRKYSTYLKLEPCKTNDMKLNKPPNWFWRSKQTVCIIKVMEDCLWIRLSWTLKCQGLLLSPTTSTHSTTSTSISTQPKKKKKKKHVLWSHIWIKIIFLKWEFIYLRLYQPHYSLLVLIAFLNCWGALFFHNHYMWSMFGLYTEMNWGWPLWICDNFQCLC